MISRGGPFESHYACISYSCSIIQSLCNLYYNIIKGVPKESLLNGGLEVILYDHHHFSHDINIGGLRFCIPEKKPAKSFSLSPDASPARSQSASPVPGEISINCKSH